MIIMSVDLGKARTGIAVCDKTEFLASPYTVIFEKSPKQLLEKVSNTAKETKAELIVVGLPKNMDGSEGAMKQALNALCRMSVEQQLRLTIFSTPQIQEEKSVKMSLTRLPPQ